MVDEKDDDKLPYNLLKVRDLQREMLLVEEGFKETLPSYQYESEELQIAVRSFISALKVSCNILASAYSAGIEEGIKWVDDKKTQEGFLLLGKTTGHVLISASKDFRKTMEKLGNIPPHSVDAFYNLQHNFERKHAKLEDFMGEQQTLKDIRDTHEWIPPHGGGSRSSGGTPHSR